jgi:hypothetical protein
MMKQLSLLAFSLCAALALPAQADHHMMQERAYGYELMSSQERNEYQDRLRAAKTEQERETLRLEHHKKMQERAKAQGKTLPEMPPAGRGPGMGPGMGPGSGMGPGPGR